MEKQIKSGIAIALQQEASEFAASLAAQLGPTMSPDDERWQYENNSQFKALADLLHSYLREGTFERAEILGAAYVAIRRYNADYMRRGAPPPLSHETCPRDQCMAKVLPGCRADRCMLMQARGECVAAALKPNKWDVLAREVDKLTAAALKVTDPGPISTLNKEEK